MTAPLANATQRGVFAEYAIGLLSDAERKSMEPLAAQARPEAPDAAHKAFVYCAATAQWDDHTVRRHAAWALWGITAKTRSDASPKECRLRAGAFPRLCTGTRRTRGPIVGCRKRPSARRDQAQRPRETAAASLCNVASDWS